jgi:hypothetical protein
MWVACVLELVLSTFPSYMILVAFPYRSIKPAWNHMQEGRLLAKLYTELIQQACFSYACTERRPCTAYDNYEWRDNQSSYIRQTWQTCQQVDEGTEHLVVNANGGGELQNTTIDHEGRNPQFYVNCASWTGIGTYSLDYVILDNASGKLGTFPSVW